MACLPQALPSLWTPQHLSGVWSPRQRPPWQTSLNWYLHTHSSSGKHFKIYSGTLHQIPSILSLYLGSGRRGKNMTPGLAPRCHTATPGETVLMSPYAEPSKVFVSLLSGYHRPAHSKISADIWRLSKECHDFTGNRLYR